MHLSSPVYVKVFTARNSLFHHFTVAPALHPTGGYDIIKTRQGKGACVSIATSYEGVYLERYSLELDVAPKLRIVRHDVPAFVPLGRLAEQDGALQHHLPRFLGLLCRHLDAYAGRRQQLRLLKVGLKG